LVWIYSAFARQTLMVMCVIGAIMPTVVSGQTVLRVLGESQTVIKVNEPVVPNPPSDSDQRAARGDKRPERVGMAVCTGSAVPAARTAYVVDVTAPPPAPWPGSRDSGSRRVSGMLAGSDGLSLAQRLEPAPGVPQPPGNGGPPPVPTLAAPPSVEKGLPGPLPAAARNGDVVRAVGPLEILDHAENLSVILRRSKLLRSKIDISRLAVVDPSVCDVVQFSPREVSIIGKGQGATHVTFWFQDPAVLPRTFLVSVTPDPEVRERREQRFALLEEILAKLFPNSKVKLIPVGDKLLVTGQARDAAEAAQILAVIRGEATNQQGQWSGGRLVEGTTTGAMTAEEVGRAFTASQVINMLRIPGVQQVALRVKIAELNRTAARSFGVDLDLDFTFHGGAVLLQSLLNASKGKSIIGTFDNNKLSFGIRYLEQHGVVRMLSEPTLVTLSGQPASFIAGGEFAVPTVVGVQGVSAVTTDFRAFGAIITFTPVVLDKDHIRLQVSPEFSKINQSLAVNGTPGLDTRSVTTTVEMRAGQTLTVAGLLDDSMTNSSSGDLPLVAQIFGTRDNSRQETELLILVTPELVHPMDPEEVPPLPGFDVTEPTNTQFFLKGQLEGRPTESYRSTIWPMLRNRYNAGGSAMISGPYGHGD
jgi:pilus assembly protein CpaC